MSTTRRGFLRMIGLGAAAVAVGPVVSRLAGESTGTRIGRQLRARTNGKFDPANYTGETHWYYIKDGIKYAPDPHPLRYHVS